MPVTSITISHDLKSVLEIVDRIAMLFQGKSHPVSKPRIRP